MQSYAEGFDILRHASNEGLPDEQRYDLDLAAIAEVWRRGSVVSSWLLDLAAMALREGSRSSISSPATSATRAKDAGPWPPRSRKKCRPTVLTAALYARFRSRTRPHVRRQAAVGAAGPVRRPCRTPALIRCVLVIFGASGDLTRRKLLPAIYNLAEAGLLPEPFAILGVARPAIDEDAYRAQMRERSSSAKKASRSIRRRGSASRNAFTTCPASSTTRRCTTG